MDPEIVMTMAELRFGTDDWTARAEAVGKAGELFASGCEGAVLDQAFALVEKGARDAKWEVRKEAARALGRTWDARATALLGRLAADANRWVQQTAQRWLEVRGRAPADPTLDQLVSVIENVKPRRMSRNELLQFARFSGDLHYEVLAGETAHELRTILTSVDGCVTALEDRLREIGREDAVVGTLSARLRERSRFLARLVNDLCTYAAAPGEFVPVNLRKAASTALELARGRVTPSRLPPRLASCIEVPDGLVVEAVEDRIVRALANVVANGIEAIKDVGEVRLTAAAGPENMVVVSVTDTGSGMEPHQVRDAFRRYASTKRAIGGTGLGLPIVKRIVEREHRGRIGIESTPGRGTTVIMEFPLHQERRVHGQA